MWFNIALTVFLFVAFFVTFSAIGNVLINQKKIETKLDCLIGTSEVVNKFLDEFTNSQMDINHGVNVLVRELSKQLMDISNEVTELKPKATKKKKTQKNDLS